MTEEEIKILMIDALDHFHGDSLDSEKCIMRRIGEYIGEDENYIWLRDLIFYWNDYETEGSTHTSKILKKAIISKVEYTQQSGLVKDNDERKEN